MQSEQSDHDYLVSPSFLEPMTMHFVQGRLCYATDERTISGIYGVTGSYNNMKALENLRRPEDALKLLARGGEMHQSTTKKSVRRLHGPLLWQSKQIR